LFTRLGGRDLFLGSFPFSQSKSQPPQVLEEVLEDVRRLRSDQVRKYRGIPGIPDSSTLILEFSLASKRKSSFLVHHQALKFKKSETSQGKI
jgi:hypothetical protein